MALSIPQYMAAIRGVESNGDYSARGPMGPGMSAPAAGAYQFTGTTAKALVKMNKGDFPELEGLSRVDMLDKLAKDDGLQDRLMKSLIADQSKTIKNLGGDPNDPKAHAIAHRTGTGTKLKDYISGDKYDPMSRIDDGAGLNERIGDYVGKFDSAMSQAQGPEMAFDEERFKEITSRETPDRRARLESGDALSPMQMQMMRNYSEMTPEQRQEADEQSMMNAGRRQNSIQQDEQALLQSQGEAARINQGGYAPPPGPTQYAPAVTGPPGAAQSPEAYRQAFGTSVMGNAGGAAAPPPGIATPGFNPNAQGMPQQGPAQAAPPLETAGFNGSTLGMPEQSASSMARAVPPPGAPQQAAAVPLPEGGQARPHWLQRLGNAVTPGQPFTEGGMSVMDGLANSFSGGERGDRKAARMERRADKKRRKADKAESRGKHKKAAKKRRKADRIDSNRDAWLMGSGS